jgi:hypothetical protein
MIRCWACDDWRWVSAKDAASIVLDFSVDPVTVKGETRVLQNIVVILLILGVSLTTEQYILSFPKPWL